MILDVLPASVLDMRQYADLLQDMAKVEQCKIFQ